MVTEHGSSSLDFTAANIDDPDSLATCLLRIGVVSRAPAAAYEDVADAVRLQAAMRRLFAATAAAKALPERDVATINSHAGDEPPALVLRADGSASRSAADPVRAGLAAVARDAIEALTRHAGDVRVCAARDCGRIFLDRSRSKGRRWCSMQRCGNRVKVVAFRRRHQSKDATTYR
jgi:predicted RNA-binding Zn ribbon-like protein